MSSAKAKPQIVLYDFNVRPADRRWDSFSSFVLKVSRALKLAGLEFELRDVDPRSLKSISPVGQLPAVDIEGERLWDSTRILRRIDTLVSGSLSLVEDPRLQAEAWLWEEFGDTSLYPYLLMARWVDDTNFAYTKQTLFGSLPSWLGAFIAGRLRARLTANLRQRDFLRASDADCWKRFAHVLNQLEARAPEQGFWLADRPCVADLSLFAHLHSLRTPQVAAQAAAIGRKVRLSAYLDRVEAATDRPA